MLTIHAPDGWSQSNQKASFGFQEVLCSHRKASLVSMATHASCCCNQKFTFSPVTSVRLVNKKEEHNIMTTRSSKRFLPLATVQTHWQVITSCIMEWSTSVSLPSLLLFLWMALGQSLLTNVTTLIMWPCYHLCHKQWQFWPHFIFSLYDCKFSLFLQFLMAMFWLEPPATRRRANDDHGRTLLALVRSYIMCMSILDSCMLLQLYRTPGVWMQLIC